MMKKHAAIAGIGESNYYKRGKATETEFQLACIAIRNAVKDAGLDLKDIDGFVSYLEPRNDPARLSAALGLKHVEFTAQTFGNGGNGMASSVMIADAAVKAGYAKNVVVFRAIAQGQFGRFGQAIAGGAGGDGGSRVLAPVAYTVPYGILSAPHFNAMQTQRFMYEHGVTQEALADIVLTDYEHAQHNPRAVRYGQPLTREDYHASRWIAKPFHLFDCCPENDGAAAAVVTTTERARDLRHGAVPILAAAQGIEHGGGIAAFNEPNFPTAHKRDVGKRLWERAGVGPADVDVAQFYENFTGMVLIAISEMGFCAPGELNEFVGNGNLLWNGNGLPINTSGGNLGEAYIHGFQFINEAVRQIRGDSSCQVNDAELSLVVAGPGYAPGSAVLFCRD